jgi:Neuraminidase (sialidase)
MCKQTIAWSLREIGLAWEKGEREDPAPQEAGKISSQYSAKAGTTWERTRKTNKLDMMKEDWHKQSERCSEKVKICNYDC